MGLPMTDIKILKPLAKPVATPVVSSATRLEPAAPPSAANRFGSLKKELNGPLKNFLTHTEKLLDQARALDLQMFKLDLQEIQTTAQQLLSLLENPPKRQVPPPAPAVEPVMLPKPLTRRARAVHNRGTLLIIDDHHVFQIGRASCRERV